MNADAGKNTMHECHGKNLFKSREIEETIHLSDYYFHINFLMTYRSYKTKWSMTAVTLGTLKISIFTSWNDKPELNRAISPTSDINIFGVKKCWTIKYDTKNRNPKWGLQYFGDGKSDKVSTKVNRNKCSFYPEQSIQNHVFKILPKDYNNSGLDRGHIIPAADFNSSQESLISTFTMANICPQNSSLNRGYWASFEAWIRNLYKTNDDIEELYVITGPVYAPVLINANWVYMLKTIGTFPKLITVPTHFFKVIVGKRFVNMTNSPGMELQQLGIVSNI